MNYDKAALAELLKAIVQPGAESLRALGQDVGRLYTDHGLPIDMALDRIGGTQLQKLAVLSGACEWLIEHKRRSGATENAIERTRKSNREMIERFIKNGETGAY